MVVMQVPSLPIIHEKEMMKNIADEKLKLIDSKTLRATLYPAGFSTGLSLPLNCLMSQHHCQGFLENSFTCLITLKSAYCPRDTILIVV